MSDRKQAFPLCPHCHRRGCKWVTAWRFRERTDAKGMNIGDPPRLDECSNGLRVDLTTEAIELGRLLVERDEIVRRRKERASDCKKHLDAPHNPGAPTRVEDMGGVNGIS